MKLRHLRQTLKQGINKAITQPALIHKRVKKYNLEPMTIISSDCSGGVICHDNGLPLDSPTVNLIISGNDYIQFCRNLDCYLAMKLIDGGRDPNYGYPIAYCGDVKILGVHYHQFSDLEAAWERRKQRVHRERIIFLMTERQLDNDADLDHFASLTGRKLFLCSADFQKTYDFVLPLKEFDRMFLFDGFSGRRFIENELDFAKWYLQ